MEVVVVNADQGFRMVVYQQGVSLLLFIFEHGFVEGNSIFDVFAAGGFACGDIPGNRTAFIRNRGDFGFDPVVLSVFSEVLHQSVPGFAALDRRPP